MAIPVGLMDLSIVLATYPRVLSSILFSLYGYMLLSSVLHVF